jgi:hypothetical protein
MIDVVANSRALRTGHSGSLPYFLNGQQINLQQTVPEVPPPDVPEIRPTDPAPEIPAQEPPEITPDVTPDTPPKTIPVRDTAAVVSTWRRIRHGSTVSCY